MPLNLCRQLNRSLTSATLISLCVPITTMQLSEKKGGSRSTWFGFQRWAGLPKWARCSPPGTKAAYPSKVQCGHLEQTSRRDWMDHGQGRFTSGKRRWTARCSTTAERILETNTASKSDRRSNIQWEIKSATIWVFSSLQVWIVCLWWRTFSIFLIYASFTPNFRCIPPPLWPFPDLIGHKKAWWQNVDD